MTIASDYGLSMPMVYTHNKAVPLKCADPSLLYGVELEIENVPHWGDLVVQGMSAVEDGSLRNHGREFITLPATYSVLMHILERFFTKAKLSDDNYSERCSVHVHANCLDMELDQVAGVCLLYQVFERLLYAFVGNDRDRNIFCIPWDQTTLTYQAITNLNAKAGGPRHWQKYTGLNIIPLADKGTLEFRQMNGTYDLERIGQWLNLIGSMYAYAKKTPLEKIKEEFVNLNTTSAYTNMTENVFTDWAYILMSVPGYKLSLEEGVLNMKYSLMNPVKSTLAKKPLGETLMDGDEVERLSESEEMAEILNSAATGFASNPVRPREAPRQRERINQIPMPEWPPTQFFSRPPTTTLASAVLANLTPVDLDEIRAREHARLREIGMQRIIRDADALAARNRIDGVNPPTTEDQGQ